MLWTSPDENDWLVKIGYAKNEVKACLMFGRKAPGNFTLLDKRRFETEEEARQVEQDMHSRFESYREPYKKEFFRAPIGLVCGEFRKLTQHLPLTRGLAL
jgi:hypothetical protein